jgi:signal recognition particle receptor subunit beta
MNAPASQNRRIVFTGPDDSSATRAIATISDAGITRDSCDVAAVDTALRLQLDHGVLHLQQAGEIHLYGTPPDTPVDTVTEFVQTGGMGLIVLLDNKRPYPLRDMHFYLHSFQAYIGETSVAVGLCNLNAYDTYSIDDYHTELISLDLYVPVFEADVTDKRDVVLLVEALLLSTEARKTLSHV